MPKQAVRCCISVMCLSSLCIPSHSGLASPCLHSDVIGISPSQAPTKIKPESCSVCRLLPGTPFKQLGLTSPGKRPYKRKRRAAFQAAIDNAATAAAADRGPLPGDPGTHREADSGARGAEQDPARRRFQAARDVLAQAREELR